MTLSSNIIALCEIQSIVEGEYDRPGVLGPRPFIIRDIVGESCNLHGSLGKEIKYLSVQYPVDCQTLVKLRAIVVMHSCCCPDEC